MIQGVFSQQKDHDSLKRRIGLPARRGCDERDTLFIPVGDESGAAVSRSSFDTFFEGQRLGRSETGASWLGTRVGPLTAASA